MFRGGGRCSFRSLVITFAGSLGGRLSWSLRCANDPADTTPSIANTSSNCRSSLIISTVSPLAKSCAGGRKRCADRRGSKTGATYFRTKSLTKRAENRTVSHLAAPYRARALAAKRHKTLTSDSDAEGTDVATRIKDPQRNRMFTRGEAAEID